MEKKNKLFANIFIWCTFSLFFSIASPVYGGIHNDPHEVLEHVMRKWEAVAIKTFEIDHHVIDCIDIYEQPAFQHPLLVNHTIQLKPNYYPNKTNDYVMDLSMSESCPDGSIPIQRAQPNGNRLSQINYLYKAPRYNAPRQQQFNGLQPYYKHEYAIFRREGTSYGGKAAINVWNPKVEKREEFSLSQIWIVSKDESTSLEAGWLVDPRRNGNDQTRFFILYTTNKYSSWCANLECPGFVQTNKGSIINPYLQPVSVFGGQQYTIDVEIFMDKTTGNWWLLLQGAHVGYWPKELVPRLGAGAYYFEFGGEIGYTWSTVHPRTSTQMGSSHFAEEGFRKSSFIRNLRVVGADFLYHDPDGEVSTITTASGCYDAQMGGKKDGPWGWFFFYGGPGRSQKCV